MSHWGENKKVFYRINERMSGGKIQATSYILREGGGMGGGGRRKTTGKMRRENWVSEIYIYI